MYRFLPMSFVDAPGMAAVVFCKGCNLRCPYCYNIDLLNENAVPEDLNFDQILENIRGLQHSNPSTGQRYNSVSWLIVSGGEPMFKDPTALKFFFQAARELGLKTGLYTNGYNTRELYELIESQIVNLIHLDVKSSMFDEHIISRLHSYFRKNYLEYLQLNTTILKSQHNRKELRLIQNMIEGATDTHINFQIKSKFKSHFAWSITPFYNNNDSIITLGKLRMIDEGFTEKELENL